MKEPDVTTYTKKYRVMEESSLKEGLFPFRETVDISFLLDELKTVCQGLVAYEMLNSTFYKV